MPNLLNILRIPLALVLVLLTLEASARVDDYLQFGAPLTGPFDIETIYEYDELGRRGKPNARYQKWKLNKFGFRGPDPVPGKLTIAVLGASETFGLYESEDMEYPRQLETVLQGRFGEGVQVASISFAGMSIGQALIRLEESLRATGADLLLVYPSPASYIMPPAGEWRLGGDPGRGLFGSLRITARLRDLFKQTIPPRIQTAIRAWQADRAFSPEERWQTIPRENVDRFRHDLNELAEAAADLGVEVVLATHATRFGDEVLPEEKDLLVSWRKFYPRLEEEGFLDMERRLNDVVRQLGRRRDLVVIEVAGKIEPGPENFADFVHFTDKGAHEMAGILADGLAPVITEHLHQEPDSAPKQVP